MTNREANEKVGCSECGAVAGEKCRGMGRPLTRGNVLIHWARYQAATKAGFDEKMALRRENADA